VNRRARLPPERVRAAIVLAVFAVVVAGAWVTGGEGTSPATDASPASSSPPVPTGPLPQEAPCEQLSRERAESLGLGDPAGRNVPVRKAGAVVQSCAYGTTRVPGTSADLATARGLTNEQPLRNLNLWAELGPPELQPFADGNVAVHRPTNRHNGESEGCLAVMQLGELEHVTAVVYDKRADKRAALDLCPYAVKLAGAAVSQ
jgi:Protein of unknown function (DUF3558)